MGEGASKLAPEDLKELTENTHFDEKEIKKWYKEYAKDWPDGQINKEQFINLYGTVYKTDNARTFAKQVFRTFDINNDGTIDFREFICSLSVTTRGSIAEKLEWAFNIYDIDGNGYISQSEMISIIKAVKRMVGVMENNYSKSNVNILKVFDQMDENKDGELSLEEFIAGARKDETFVNMLQAYTPY